MRPVPAVLIVGVFCSFAAAAMGDTPAGGPSPSIPALAALVTATVKSGGDESHGAGDKISVSSLSTLQFHADGTFTRAGAVDLGVTGKTSNTETSSKSGDHGKYQFSGNTLTMTHSDGKTELLTAYPMPDKDESPPKHLNINGAIYALEK